MSSLVKVAGLTLAGSVGAWWLARRVRQAAFSFADKTVLITGGSRGLGLELARLVTRAGARVAICARDPGELERAATNLGQLGRKPFYLAADISNESEARQFVGQAESELGPIDVVINNASVIQVGPLSTMRRADFEEALGITFWGAFNIIEAVLTGMRQRRTGRIVNISSIGGKIGIPHLLPYSVAKFALAGYSQGLRAELANNGITVTAVYPGLMRTGSPRHASFKGQHRAEYAWFSISDSLPLLTVSSTHAARSILNACRRGDAELVISVPAKAAVCLNALCPELTAVLLDASNRLMPRPKAARPQAHEGKESTSEWSPSVLTTLTEKAARRNNEMSPQEAG